MHGEFTWVDLSTIDLPKAEEFYRTAFSWEFAEETSGYVNCLTSGVPCAGIFEMPELFQKIKMPSFWMTYLSVDDISLTVERARSLGGTIELEESNARGEIALIRDPAGAGFTCYSGPDMSSRNSNPTHGQWLGSELFISNFSAVETFYSELFGWTFEKDAVTPDRYIILNSQGKRIGGIQVASNDVKGEKEYWGIFFAVSDVDKALANVRSAGGHLIYNYSYDGRASYLITDSQGAAFFLTGLSKTDTKNSERASNANFKLKWRSFIGLILVYSAIFLELDWLWGALFLFWVIPDLKSGSTYFIEPLDRSTNPALYWSVVLTWITLSIYLLLGAA